MGDIKKAVEWAVKIANDPTHGYDQEQRNGPDYDCSSLVATALKQAGFNVSEKSWTGNLKEQLMAEGFYLCTAPWMVGDIHLNTQKHVCMSVDADMIVEASLNELGGIAGGQSGDQTGNEISIKPFYEYRHGWNYHLRAPQNKNVSPQLLMYVSLKTMSGAYGNNPDRYDNLRKQGYVPECVQEIINFVYQKAEEYYG